MKSLTLGIRTFNLFSVGKLEDLDLKGLSFKSDAVVPTEDHANLRTLVNLVRNCRNLKLINTLEKGKQILMHLLAQNAGEFNNLTGLEIDFDHSISTLI